MSFSYVDKAFVVPPDSFPLVSIIIPAYNSGRFLKTMLDSIYSQTYPSLEVIVAYDEKSSDDTLNILKYYEENYHLIIDSNKDSSSGTARNRGLLLANGEYVIFLDADDIIIPEYIESLVKIFLEYPDLDVVCGNRALATESDYLDCYESALKSPSSIQIHTQKEALHNMVLGRDYCGEPWVWLVKKNYLNNYGIRFPDYSYGDDTVYVLKLILNTHRVGYNTKKGYVYIEHPSSVTNRIPTYLELYEKRTNCRRDITELLMENHMEIYEEYCNVWNRALALYFSKFGYEEFMFNLKKYNIQCLRSVEGDCLLAIFNAWCFNMSKSLYWFICHFVIKAYNRV